MIDRTRHGVFLRPDPLTCAAVTRIAAQLRAQYGLVSAGAFPPHATLAGSLPLGDRVDSVSAALHERLAAVAPFVVPNAGIVKHVGGGVTYDIHSPALADLAALVDATVRPFLAPVEPGELPPDVYAPGAWIGHLSLASHDLAERPDLLDEVYDYARGLDVPCPAAFAADTVALYRFEHDTWRGAWWRDLRWAHVRSWRLSSPAPGAP